MQSPSTRLRINFAKHPFLSVMSSGARHPFCTKKGSLDKLGMTAAKAGAFFLLPGALFLHIFLMTSLV
jgi:hypothetical protein